MEQICVLAAHLSDLLYLGPSLPDERAALAGGDDQPQGDRWLGADGAVGHQCGQVLEGDTSKEKSVVRVGGKERGVRVPEEKLKQRGSRWKRRERKTTAGF